jgi:hypothetical protein
VLTGDPLRAPQRGMLVPLLFLPLYYVLPLGGSVAPGRFLGALPFNLSDVRIHGDTFFGRAQAENTAYLSYLDADRLLYNFRLVAGLDPSPAGGGAVLPYGGWIANGSLVAGHFTGHFLSATAFTTGATGDPAIAAKSAYLVAELAKCQEHICTTNSSMCGYLSAFSFNQIVALEEHSGPTWAPTTPSTRSSPVFSIRTHRLAIRKRCRLWRRWRPSSKSGSTP